MARTSLKTADITNAHDLRSVSFTPDGMHVVGGDTAGGIYRWKMEDAQPVGPAMATAGQVTTVAVSKDGQWIVTGDWQGKILVWNAITHQKALEIPRNLRSVWAVDITSDSTRIAAGLYDSMAWIFSITTGASLIPPIQHQSPVAGLKFSPAGDRIATATYDRASVRIYDSHTGDKLFDIQVHVQSYPITPLTWSLDGQKVFAISPGKITCLDTSTSTCSEWSINNVDVQACIVGNGKFLACSTGDSVSFWDAVSHKQIGRVLSHATKIQCIALSPDEGYLACGNGKKISFHELSDILPSQYLLPPASRPPLMEVSLSAIEPWMQGNTERTEVILSHEIKEPNPGHHVSANRALIRARLNQWNTAIDDAEMSLHIKPSPIGHIAKTLALVGAGKKDLALSEFDFAFYVCDSNDVKFLLLIKSIVVFESGNHEDAIFRVSGLIPNADKDTRYYCIQVLGNMYLKRGDYEGAIRSLRDAPPHAVSDENPQLTTITLIFGWNFSGIETTAWTRLCETLYASGRIKEVGETLVKMVDSLAEDEREAAHCRILEEIVTRSSDVALLSWTGQPSAYNSCLPASPATYTQTLYTPPTLVGEAMEVRTAELRTSFLQIDALIIHDWITRSQPVRFTGGRLLLPCLPFHVQSLSKNEANTYHAKVTWLGNVEFTTEDTLPLDQPRRLVFVHPWFHLLCDPRDKVISEDGFVPDVDVSSNLGLSRNVEVDTDIVHASLIEEAPLAPDTYTRALQLIARLGQPFNALLLLKQPDGTYKRVAAEHEIIIPGLGSNAPKDIRAEVVEIV